MENLKQAVAWLLIAGFVGALLMLLGAIVRFSILSPIITRNAAARLRKPIKDGLKELVGFDPSPSLLRFFKTWPYIEKNEFDLVDPQNSARWCIGGFIPLTKRDIKEQIKISGKHGLPIADDTDKGAYFIQADGSIELWSPNVPSGHIKVAQSIEEMSTFNIVAGNELTDEDA